MFNAYSQDKRACAVSYKKGSFGVIEVSDVSPFFFRKSRFVYCALLGDAVLCPGIIKFDLTKEPDLSGPKLEVGGNVVGVYMHGSGRYGGEPVYVPKNPGTDVDEDDGYVLNFVFDENTS